MSTISTFYKASHKSEAFASPCQAYGQLLTQNLLAFIIWQIELIETCVGFGQLVFAWIPMYWYSLDSIHAYQVRKSLNWDLWCPGNKLHQLCNVLLWVLSHDFPKPDYDLVTRIIPRVVCISFHIFDVNFRHSRNQKFQFLRLKVRDALLRYNLIEAF